MVRAGFKLYKLKTAHYHVAHKFTIDYIVDRSIPCHLHKGLKLPGASLAREDCSARLILINLTSSILRQVMNEDVKRDPGASRIIKH